MPTPSADDPASQGSAIDPELKALGDDPVYQAWVANLAKQCSCSGDRPCDGLLAGGFCDGLHFPHHSNLFDDEA